MRALRFKDWKAKGVAGSRASLHRIREVDPTFPKPIQIGGSIAWYEHEIDGWMEARPRIVTRKQASMVADNKRATAQARTTP